MALRVEALRLAAGAPVGRCAAARRVVAPRQCCAHALSRGLGHGSSVARDDRPRGRSRASDGRLGARTVRRCVAVRGERRVDPRRAPDSGASCVPGRGLRAGGRNSSDPRRSRRSLARPFAAIGAPARTCCPDLHRRRRRHLRCLRCSLPRASALARDRARRGARSRALEGARRAARRRARRRSTKPRTW